MWTAAMLAAHNGKYSAEHHENYLEKMMRTTMNDVEQSELHLPFSIINDLFAV